jgi:WD40 repeat protein
LQFVNRFQEVTMKNSGLKSRRGMGTRSTALCFLAGAFLSFGPIQGRLEAQQVEPIGQPIELSPGSGPGPLAFLLPPTELRPPDVVTFSHSGKVFVRIDGNRLGGENVRIYSAETGAEFRFLEHSEKIRAVAFSPDSKTLLTASKKVAYLWDVESGKIMLKLPVPGSIRSVAFEPKGGKVFAIASGKNVQFWDLAGKQVGPTLKHPEDAYSVVFSPDGKTILTGCVDEKARLWEFGNGKNTGAFPHNASLGPAFSVSGRTILTVLENRRSVFLSPISQSAVQIWQTATRKLYGPPILNLGGDSYAAVALSPDGGTLATVGTGGGVVDPSEVMLWDPKTAKGKLRGKRLLHDGDVTSLSFSRDSKYLLTGSKDKTARLWNLQTGKLLASLKHDTQVQALGFNPDPKNATFFTKSENEIRLWRIEKK